MYIVNYIYYMIFDMLVLLKKTITKQSIINVIKQTYQSTNVEAQNQTNINNLNGCYHTSRNIYALAIKTQYCLLSSNKNNYQRKRGLYFNYSYSFSTDNEQQVSPIQIQYKRGCDQIKRLQKLNGKDNPEYINRLFAHAQFISVFYKNSNRILQAKQMFKNVEKLLENNKQLMSQDGKLHLSLNPQIYAIHSLLGELHFNQMCYYSAIKQFKKVISTPNPYMKNLNIAQKRGVMFLIYRLLMRANFHIRNVQEARVYYQKIKDMIISQEQIANSSRTQQLIQILFYIRNEHLFDKTLALKQIETLINQADLQNMDHYEPLYQALNIYENQKDYSDDIDNLLQKQIQNFGIEALAINDTSQLSKIIQINIIQFKQNKSPHPNTSPVQPQYQQLQQFMDYYCTKIVKKIIDATNQLKQGKIEQSLKSIQQAIQHCADIELISASLNFDHLKRIKYIQKMEQFKKLGPQSKMHNLLFSLRKSIIHKSVSSRSKFFQVK